MLSNPQENQGENCRCATYLPTYLPTYAHRRWEGVWMEASEQETGVTNYLVTSR